MPLGDFAPACAAAKSEVLADGSTQRWSPSEPVFETVTAWTPPAAGLCSWGEIIVNPSPGSKYVVEVEATNRAGGQSIWRSAPFIADSTPPKVVDPLVASGSLNSRDAFISRRSDSGVMLHYIGPGVTKLLVTPLCHDSESGVHIAHVSAFFHDTTGTRVWLAQPREVIAGRQVLMEFDVSPGVENLGRRAEVRCLCWNRAGLFAGRARQIEIALPQSCDHWKLLIESVTRNGSHFQGSAKQLSLLTERWGESFIRDDHAGLARMQYALVDQTTEVAKPLTQLSHDGLPPVRLSQFGLNMLHNHTYFVVASSISAVGYAHNESWRMDEADLLASGPRPGSCRSFPISIDLTPPKAGVLRVLHYSREQKLGVAAKIWRHQFRGDVAMIFVPGWEDPESRIATVTVTVYSMQGAILNGPMTLPFMEYIPISIGLNHLESYFYELTATNSAGLSTTGRSPSVTIDTTKPVAMAVGDGDDANNEIDVFPVLGPISVRWDALDPDSGLDAVEWCVGTAPGMCDVASSIPISIISR